MPSLEKSLQEDIVKVYLQLGNQVLHLLYDGCTVALPRKLTKVKEIFEEV